MKKITILILLALAFMAVIVPTVLAGCSGTCTDCTTYDTDQTSCLNQAGCVFSGPNPKTCKGTCTACTTYVTESTCAAQSGCSWTNECGDNVCDSTEDCSCADCEGEQAQCLVNYYCSGGSCVYSGAGGTCGDAGGICLSKTCGSYQNCETESGGSCTTGYCCIGSCTTLLSDCGNGFCDTDESCITCPGDCGGCVEDAITVSYNSPLNGDTVRRGPLLVKVTSFYGTGPSSGAYVYTESELIEGRLRLYDDGKHEDGRIYDGTFANTLIIDRDAEPKIYTLTTQASEGGAIVEERARITLDPEIKVNLTDFRSSYAKGERMEFNGIVENFNGPVAGVEVNLKMEVVGGILFNETYTTGSDGSFADTYPISFADPDGYWTITLTAQDEYGNHGQTEIKPNIGTPEGVSYYLVEFLSPVKGTPFIRGSSVPLSVEVTEESDAVDGATVTFRTPRGEYQELEPAGAGVYTGDYDIGLIDPAGEWRLAVQAIKKVDNVTRAGGNTIRLQINPGKINIELLAPVEEVAYAGQVIDYRLKATYPDGSPVQGAKLTSTLSNNETLEFTETDPGVYTAGYFVDFATAGALNAKITVNDEEGNVANLNNVVHIEESNFVNSSLRWILNRLLKPYWFILLGILVLLGVIYRPKIEKRVLDWEFSRAQKEEKKIKGLMINAEENYYKKGLISKEDFNKLKQEYHTRLAKTHEKRKMQLHELAN